MRHYPVIWIIAVAAISSCASIRDLPIDPSASSKLAGKEVVVVKRPMPDFAAMTVDKMAGAGLFGAIGGAIAGALMIQAGNSLVKDNSISDPAYEVAQEIAQGLEAKYFVKYAGLGAALITADDTSSISMAYKAAGLALDVKTTNWGFVYLPFNWGRYRVIYGARLRLIETANDGVLVEGKCSSRPEISNDALTYDELLENHADRLKSELQKAAKLCVEQFSTKYLGM